VVQPILGAILWPTIAVAVALGTSYGLSSGSKKKGRLAEPEGEGQEVPDRGIEGFFILFVLILSLRIAVPILEDW
jgi:hypothetical protein